MPATIGIRVYRFDFRKRGTGKSLPFNSELMERHPRLFVEDFISNHTTVNDSKENERSWYFDRKPDQADGIRGYVRYGTYGFESNLVDTQTKKNNYRRKTTDVEEIPLYFDFFIPKNANLGLAAFQSFQGRSCISLVTTRMKDVFERSNNDCILNFKKVLPSDLKGSAFFSAPIKRMKLIRNKVPVDIADKYVDPSDSSVIDIELSLNARRKMDLGKLGRWQAKMPSNQQGLIEYAGMEFDEAIAEIKVGNRLRKVGVFGHNSDAGVIDITENISKGADGHPTYDSLQRETVLLLEDFYKTLSRR